MWTAACLGLAVGVGFYELAVIGFFAVLLINSWLQTLENYLLMNSRIIRLYIEYNSDKPISALVDFSRDNRYDVLDLQIKRSKLNIEITTIILLLRSEVKRSHDEIIRSWQIIEGVQFIEEIE